jgi:hypothetical protein
MLLSNTNLIGHHLDPMEEKSLHPGCMSAGSLRFPPLLREGTPQAYSLMPQRPRGPRPRCLRRGRHPSCAAPPRLLRVAKKS